ncbi:hypothetical protein KC19_6G173100 [Ceratodon purpureus]|uniref:Uncharacterized protein n=1 Tax=Ceratodon purpureus TaxID=3225 RepID=A0A8T0HIL3_CERPU|nr:hypothetical protein KC19_6G173100 [Ceratodon purpureus]
MHRVSNIGPQSGFVDDRLVEDDEYQLKVGRAGRIFPGEEKFLILLEPRRFIIYERTPTSDCFNGVYNGNVLLYTR